MALIAINKNPSRRDLRIFAALLPIFFGAIGAARWHAGSTTAAVIIWGVGVALSVPSLVSLAAARATYLAWLYATYPLGWLVSHVILAVTYFLIATPMAVLLRMFGRDPMQARFDKTTKSYWILRRGTRTHATYFRQF